jgi:hypothetical protein
MRRKKLIAILGLLALAFGSPLVAATIYYEPVDLPDQVQGDDLWRYNYLVTGFTFNSDQGFTISFDIDRYRDLEIPPIFANNDWDVLVFQPDSNLPADGAYDALALVNGASLQATFPVDFIFLGAGQPGSQRFDISQFDSQGNLVTVLESGFTTLIPEPGPLLLTFFGLSALYLWSFRKRRRGLRP